MKEETIYDQALPQHFFEEVLREPTCDHPWNWFLWSYSEKAPVFGLPAPKTLEALRWCRRTNTECDTDHLEKSLSFTPYKRSPLLEQEYARLGVDLPGGVWVPEFKEDTLHTDHFVCLLGTPLQSLPGTILVPRIKSPERKVCELLYDAVTKLGAPFRDTDTNSDLRELGFTPFLDYPTSGLHMKAERFPRPHTRSMTPEVVTVNVDLILKWIKDNTADD